MSYTSLRVVEAGVVLYDGHERRFANDKDAVLAFRRFAADALPGIYLLTWKDGRMDVATRESSSLLDGMPVRYLPSPLTASVPKSAPPNPFSSLRVPGVAILLTSPDGTEIYESCSASVICWDGKRLVAPPVDRPRLISTAMKAIELGTQVEHRPLRVDSSAPLALVNAVAGIVIPDVPGREPFPAHVREVTSALLMATARR